MHLVFNVARHRRLTNMKQAIAYRNVLKSLQCLGLVVSSCSEVRGTVASLRLANATKVSDLTCAMNAYIV